MFISRLLLPSMILLAVSACGRTQQATTAALSPSSLSRTPQGSSMEDCKRRAAGMATQERDMRSSPQEVVDTSAPPPKSAEWSQSNNPCSETAMAIDPTEDRLIARTQVETAMQEKNYAHARLVLPKLYTSPSSLDLELQALTRQVTTAFSPEWIAGHEKENSIIMREGQPVCVATREPHAIHDDYVTLSELVVGDTLHIYCGVPHSQANIGTQVRVRYRQGTGQYGELMRQELGWLPDLTVDEGVHITLTLPEDFLAIHEQAYIEVNLMGLAQGQTPNSLAKGSFFWVK